MGKYPAQERWYQENKEQVDKYRAEWARKDRLENPEFYRAREFAREMKKYGTTTERYLGTLIEQRGLCAICNHLSHHHGTLQRLQVDHDHKCCDLKTKSCGKCLRGLLCAECNMLLSYLERTLREALVIPFPQLIGTKESWTAKALRYLAKWKAQTQNFSSKV